MRALVLSCGPSLAEFDGNTAGYDLVAGVNDVVARFPVDWWVLGDDVTITRNMDHLAGDVRHLFLNRFPVIEGHTVTVGVRESEFVAQRHWLRWYDFAVEWPRHLLRFSGCAALALCALKGATVIDVIGVDMDGVSDFNGSDGSHAVRDEQRWADERRIWREAVDFCASQGIQVNWPAKPERPGPIFTTFYTTDHPYLAYGQAWKEQMALLGVDHDAVEMDLEGQGWAQRVRLKPWWMLESLRTHRDRAVVWVDADSDIITVPPIPTGCDLGVVECPKDVQRCGRYSAAFLYANNNERVREFMAYWLGLCRGMIPTKAADQEPYEVAIETFRPKLNVQILPWTYAWMDCFPDEDKAFIKGHQASRVARCSNP